MAAALLIASSALIGSACTATTGSDLAADDDDASEQNNEGGAAPSGTGGTDDAGVGGGIDFSGSGGGTSQGGEVTELKCSDVAQEILVLDFRSGWWSGGGGGEFYDVALAQMAQTCSNITVEYHHFEVDFIISCLFDNLGGSCQNNPGDINALSQAQILALFEQPSWDDYTQVWILSGSEQDAADVSLTGGLMTHFLAETNNSCIPVLVAAGDGFIDHGNTVTGALGLGTVFSTEYPLPNFFSVAQGFGPVSITSTMSPNAAGSAHVLFSDVDTMVDGLSSAFQTTHGDSLDANNPAYEILATDSSGRPAIAAGFLQIPGDEERPFILDSGFQRFYAMGQHEGTSRYLRNIVQYFGLVGCKAPPPPE